MTSRYNLRSRQKAVSIPKKVAVMEISNSKSMKQSRSRKSSGKKSCKTPRTTKLNFTSIHTVAQTDGASGGRSPGSPVRNGRPTAARADRDQAPAICDGCQEYCSPVLVSEPGYDKDTLPCVEVELTDAELRQLPLRFQLDGAACNIHLPEVMPGPRLYY